MDTLLAVLLVLHVLTAILMAWPIYALVAVNQRVRLGPRTPGDLDGSGLHSQLFINLLGYRRVYHLMGADASRGRPRSSDCEPLDETASFMGGPTLPSA